MPLTTMNILRASEAFFFRRIPSTGFSLMRVAWAFVTGSFLLMQWKDTTDYYSDIGLLPHRYINVFVRSNYHFTVLDWVTEPNAVFSLYLILLLALFCMMIGLWPRVTTIVSVLLLFSFHERNPTVLGGGDTLLRSIGFLLMLSPGIHGFSISRLPGQWRAWRNNGSLLPSPTMPIWPWRLLLWQMIVLYATSLWYKLLGTMWLDGTAVEAAFHHPVFVRWPDAVVYLLPFTGITDLIELAWQGSWLLLLIPRVLTRSVLGRFARIPLKRVLIIGGLFFHGGIFLIMDAGVFSLAVFTAYIGLLREEDFVWLKQVAGSRAGGLRVDQTRNSQLGNSITVLYDGNCGLCLRSVFWLRLLDHLKSLRFVDFRDTELRTKVAPHLKLEDLDRAMHILVPDQNAKLEARSYRGFDAFRHMAWGLPALWIAAPFLYIPPIPFVGRKIYGQIALRRKTCTHEKCTI